MSSLLLYLFIFIGKIHNVAEWALLGTGFALVILGVPVSVCVCLGEAFPKGAVSAVRGCLLGLFLAVIAYVAVPDTKEIAAIYVIPRVVNSEFVQEGANEFKELAIGWMRELKPQVGETK